MKIAKILMSVLRILLGVIVGIAGLSLLWFLLSCVAKIAPSLAPHLYVLLLAWTFSGYGVWNIVTCLRTGGAGGGKSCKYYERNVSPFHFWCNFLFFSFIGVFAFTVGVCAILFNYILRLNEIEST